MNKQPLVFLSYVMLVTVLVFGFSGAALTWPEAFPPQLAWFVERAEQARMLALLAAFTAVSIASMFVAEYAEQFWRAEQWRMFWACLLFFAPCFAIEVYLGHLGAETLGLSVAPVFIGLAVGFLAFAPRLAKMIKAGKDAIDKAEAELQKRSERKHELDMTDALTRQNQSAIEKGVIELDKHRGKGNSLAAPAAALGASLGLLGVTGDIPEARAEYPIEAETFTLTSPAVSSDRVDTAGVWERGPQPKNREKFESALNIISRDPELSEAELAKRLNVDRKTAVQWKGWAQAILSHSPNSDLIELASASPA